MHINKSASRSDPSAPAVATGPRLAWPGLLLAFAALGLWPRAPLDGYEPVKLGLATLVLAAALWRWHLPWPRPGILAVAAAGSLAATLLCSADPLTACFGSPQRSQGVLALLPCLLAAWLAAATPAAARQALLAAVVPVTLLVALLALLQASGLDPLRLAAPRPAASFGNAMLLGQWLVLVLPLCLLAAQRAEQPGPARLALLLGGLALLASGSRAALLALLLVAGGAWLLRQALAPRQRLALLAAGLVIASVLLALAAAWRPASIEQRLQLWQATLQVLAEPPHRLGPDRSSDPFRLARPWLGYGPDLGVLPLREHVSSQQTRYGSDPDRAHQWLLDLLLRWGALGVAVAVAGMIVLVRWLRRLPDRAFASAAGAALLAWWLALQSGFALSADSLMAALLLGCCRPTEAAPRPPASRSQRALAALLATTAVLLWLLPPAPLAPAGLAWRAPERAVLAYGQARTLLQSAAPGAAGCPSALAAARALQQARQLDRLRPEYHAAARQLEAQLALRCAAAAQGSSQKQ